MSGRSLRLLRKIARHKLQALMDAYNYILHFNIPEMSFKQSVTAVRCWLRPLRPNRDISFRRRLNKLFSGDPQGVLDDGSRPAVPTRRWDEDGKMSIMWGL